MAVAYRSTSRQQANEGAFVFCIRVTGSDSAGHVRLQGAILAPLTGVVGRREERRVKKERKTGALLFLAAAERERQSHFLTLPFSCFSPNNVKFHHVGDGGVKVAVEALTRNICSNRRGERKTEEARRQSGGTNSCGPNERTPSRRHAERRRAANCADSRLRSPPAMFGCAHLVHNQ